MKITDNTIYVPLESFLDLLGEHYLQRNGKPLPEHSIANLKEIFANICDKQKNMYAIPSFALGGCKEGYQTSWSVADMQNMLNTAGLPWEDGPEVASISLPIW